MSGRDSRHAVLLLLFVAAVSIVSGQRPSRPGRGLRAVSDARANTISVFRAGETKPLLTQHARPAERPYIHPLVAPDGNGLVTEVSPGHHPHQTGLYWGFTRLNGRDYFHNRGADYWRRVSASVTRASGDEVQWQTVYDLLDPTGNPVMTETQRWSMREQNGRFLLNLEWRGEAKADVTIGKYDYGGLFLRMPWRPGTKSEVVNAARHRNERAEGQRAMWIDVGMQVEGRSDLVHVAIFDHPANAGYPQPWRVDAQFGVGAAPSRSSDWSIAKGRVESIRHQIVVYAGRLNDVELTSAWTDYVGIQSTSALWDIAQQEGRAAAFLTADEAVKQMTTLEGYTVNAWASEPMIVQPMAFCWDDRGRLWVAENRDYESRVSGFSNAGNSRILILEDTNRDGVADVRKVFMEGIVFPSALAVGFDGVFVGAPPNLLFIPDRDGDDKADTDAIEIRLTGWGIRDRHEVLNSLHWGPDGWLYGLQGYATSSTVRKPAANARLYKAGEPFPEDVLSGDGEEINGGVWRYHPTKDRFEIVAHGFSNPWGIDYDAKGQLFISACVIPHLFHVIPGGIYHRQGGQHFNPYVYSDIQTIADHRHRSAHGGARVYMSDAFPASQQGRVFMANIHEHAVLSDVLDRRGSGFSAHHGDDFLMANNAQWIGFSLEIGPDGAVYVLDWHDADICGMEVLRKETGRVFRIAPKQSLAENWPGRYSDLRALSDAQLVDLQTNRSDWHARRARIILQNRAAKRQLQPDTHDRLRHLFTSSTNGDWRLRAMWALHVTGGWNEAGLTAALRDRDEHIRAWAIQLLMEDRSPSPAAMDAFTEMARGDRSPIVRLYLASALQRMNDRARGAIAAELMAHGEDAGDHNIPRMLWFGFEPLVKTDPALALERAGRSNIPMIARFTARRSVDADAVDPVIAAIASGPKTQASLLEGLRDGLEGRFDVSTPASWPRVFAQLKQSGDRVAQLAAEVERQFDSTETARQNLALVRNKTTAAAERQRALQILAAQRRPQLASELPRALNDEAVRLDAIRAIAAYDEDALGKALIDKYSTFTPAEKREAIQTLASRRRYGRQLTDALSQSVIPRSDVPVYAARQLRRVVGTPFTEVWGPVEQIASEERAFTRYRGLLNDATLARASPAEGKAVYQRTCGACHKLYGDGGTIGPDLTGSNRGNLDYLLFNVLNPNGEVQDAYKVVVITTRDGRTFSGTLAAETDRQVILRIVDRDAVAINKADIQSREATNVSMMPVGLFDALTDREVINLVGYLRTMQPTRP